MMPRLYEPENTRRVRLAQIAIAVIAVGLSGYMAATTLLSMREVWSAQRSLRDAKTQSAKLSRQAARERRRILQCAVPEKSGVDSFAVRFSQWARPRQIRIESVAPEGAATPGEVSSGDVRLGIWNANKVRVKGNGGYRELMSLLREVQRTRDPVRLESFVLQAAQRSGETGVAFDLLLTVYEKIQQAGGQNAAG